MLPVKTGVIRRAQTYASKGPKGMGTMPTNYQTTVYKGYKNDTPSLSDPTKALEQTSQRLSDSYQELGGPQIEQELLASIEESTTEEALRADEIARNRQAGIDRRNLERYGIQMTAAEAREIDAQGQRNKQLGIVNATNISRFSDKIGSIGKSFAMGAFANTALGKAMQGLSAISGMQQAQEQAYRNARSSAKNARRGLVTSVVSKFI